MVLDKIVVQMGASYEETVRKAEEESGLMRGG